MNNLSETEINKFKVGDLVVCIAQTVVHDYKLPLNEIFEVKEPIQKPYLSFIGKEIEGYDPLRFRLATPAEIRKFRGFTEELESLIKE